MNPGEFLDVIKEDRDKTEEAYRIQSALFLQHYNYEQELAAEYHGRQILELMQNADDAGASELTIDLDTNNNILTVSNNGSPFTTEGIKSIMMGGLSTKPKAKFIGNKGLGFRSILKWSSSITLYTQGCKIAFSEDRAKEKFNKMVSADEQSKIRSERGLSDATIPFPILSLPQMDLDRNGVSKNNTVLEIRYDSLMKDSVQEQINKIGPELLIFLKHIETVHIYETNKVQQTIHLTKTTRDKFSLDSDGDLYLAQSGDIIWNVLYKEELLPDKYQDTTKDTKQHYSIGVAWRDDLGDNIFKLFSFFPTKEQLNLPCIVHATFDLSSNRNGLNESLKNDFILSELVGLLQKVSLKMRDLGVDWRPYHFLTPVMPNSNTNFTGLFQNLTKARLELPIFPCVDKQYRYLSQTKVYTQEFVKWILENSFSDKFPELLLPIPNEFSLKEAGHERTYAKEDFVSRIDGLSPYIKSNSHRASLITMLENSIFPGNPYERCYYQLLTDDEGRPIPKDKVAFTPQPKGREKMKIPNFIKLDLINEQLYNELDKLIPVNALSEKRERAIEGFLRPILNIQDYDASPIIRKIVQDTFLELQNRQVDEKPAVVREMVSALYLNYRNINTKEFKREFAIPLVNSLGDIVNAEDLYLGKGYPSGEITSEIYDGFFSGEEYVIDNNFWQLNANDDLESFFIWLGVNQFSKIKKLTKDWQQLSDYINYLNKIDPKPSPTYDFNKIADVEVSQLAEFNIIKQLPLHKIVLLTLHDEKIRKKLYQDHQDSIKWDYVRRTYELVGYKPSFIQYQFKTAALFSNYVIGEYSKELINVINSDLDFNYKYLFQYGFSEQEVNDKLVLLSAARSFDQLYPTRIYTILRSLKQRDIHGDTTQMFYKLALNLLEQKRYEPNEQEIQGLEVFAKRGTSEREWRIASDVYYSNDTVLPETITREKWILNMPKRFGEDKVSKFLGVKLFSSFALEIVEGTAKHHFVQEELEKWLEDIHPYLLAFRFRDKEIEQTTKEQAASLLRNYKIYLVSEARYILNKKEEKDLKENEFINPFGGRTFYVCASAGSNLSMLRSSTEFSNAIAEVLCIVSKVWDHRDNFRNIFRNGAEDTRQQLIRNGEESYLKAAQSLLGMAASSIEFWKTLLLLYDNTQFPESIRDEKRLALYLKSKYGFIIPSNYNRIDFTRLDNEEGYLMMKSIQSFFQVPIEAFSDRIAGFPGLSKWHEKNLINSERSLEKKFVTALWIKLQGAIQNKQKEFIPTKKKYQSSLSKHVTSIAKNKCYVLDAKYEEEICLAIKKEFNLEISDVDMNVEVVSYYPELKIKYPLYQEVLDEGNLSLFFFEGNKEVLEALLKDKEENDEDEDSNEEPKETTLLIKQLQNGVLPPIIRKKNRSASTHNSKKEKEQRKAGKSAESLVRDYLVGKYGKDNVKWISGNSTEENVVKDDGKGYDIEYFIPDTNEWYYLEVKSVSDRSFIISANEVEVGLTNKEKYHLALVNDNEISLIIDFFLDKVRIQHFKTVQQCGSIRSLDFEVFFELSYKGENENALMEASSQEVS